MDISGKKKLRGPMLLLAPNIPAGGTTLCRQSGRQLERRTDAEQASPDHP
jgi:hypothetical protein